MEKVFVEVFFRSMGCVSGAFQFFGQSSRRGNGVGRVPDIEFESQDLFVAAEVVDEVGQGDAPSVARQTDGTLEESIHATGHKRKGMFEPAAGFAFLSVGVLLFLGQGMAASTFFAYLRVDSFFGEHFGAGLSAVSTVGPERAIAGFHQRVEGFAVVHLRWCDGVAFDQFAASIDFDVVFVAVVARARPKRSEFSKY